MTKTYFIDRKFRSSDPFEIVFDKLERSLGNLGGSQHSEASSGTITIQDGKGGIDGGFLFDCRAEFKLEQKGDGSYNLHVAIDKSPTVIFYLALIGGLCLLWPLWALNVWYLVIDLGNEYQKRLNTFENML